MASYQAAKVVSLIAGESLASDIYEIVQFENDGGVAKVIKATAVTNTVIGVVAENLDATSGADGETVPIALLTGILKMKAGATITAGQLIVPDTTAGRVAGVANAGALAADSMAIGVALQSAVDGDIFEVLAMPIAAPHSA
jgi:hypothetical protein